MHPKHCVISPSTLAGTTVALPGWIHIRKLSLRLYTQKQLQWTNKVVKLLGVQLTVDRTQLWKLNYETIIAKLQNVITVWQQRKITLFGKITVIQSLLVSQL